MLLHYETHLVHHLLLSVHLFLKAPLRVPDPILHMKFSLILLLFLLSCECCFFLQHLLKLHSLLLQLEIDLVLLLRILVRNAD